MKQPFIAFLFVLCLLSNAVHAGSMSVLAGEQMHSQAPAGLESGPESRHCHGEQESGVAKSTPTMSHGCCTANCGHCISGSIILPDIAFIAPSPPKGAPVVALVSIRTVDVQDNLYRPPIIN